MKPMGGEALDAGRALGLGDFVFVVRKAEVDAATVQVKRRPKVFERHRRALDVPTGPAFAPRARPEIRTVFGLAGLPEGEIGSRLAFIFVGVVRFARAVGALRLKFGEI